MSGFAPTTKKVDIEGVGEFSVPVPVWNLLGEINTQLSAARAEAAALRILLTQLAPEEPMNQDEQGGCVWCGWSEDMWFYERRGDRTDYKRGSMYSDTRPETHTPDCPWIAARRILEQTRET